MAAATVKADPDELARWWQTFSSGITVDQAEDEDEEPVAEEEQNAGEASRARVEEQGRAAAAARHREEEVPGDGYVRLQAGLLTGRERKPTPIHVQPRTTGADIQDEKGEYIAEDSYAQIEAALLQVRNMEATVTASKLQPTATGSGIHEKKCSGYKKDYQVAAEEEIAVMAASKRDVKMMAAAQEPSSGAAANCHCDEEEGSEDGYVQLQGGLLGTKRKAIVTHAEPHTAGTRIQDEKGEYIAEDNYAQIETGLRQVRNMQATVTAGILQPTTGTEIHDTKCSGYKKDHQVAVKEEEEDAGVAATENDGKMMVATQAPVEEPSRHIEEEEEVPGVGYVQLQPGLLIGRKRKPTPTHAESRTNGTKIQDEKGHDAYIAENSYTQIGGVLQQGRKREATVTAGKLQPAATGTGIHEKKCSGCKKDCQVAAEEEIAGVTASERDIKMMAAAKAPAQEPSSGTTAHCHCYEEEGSENGYVQGLLGTKRKAIGTDAEPQTARTKIQDEKGEYIAVDNYTHIEAGLLQVRNMESTVTAGELQPTTGTEIHDTKCSGYKKDHQVVVQEEIVVVAASESEGKSMAATQGPVEEPSSGAAADRDEEEAPGDCYVQLQGGLLIGRKRKCSGYKKDYQVAEEEIADMAASERAIKMMVDAQAPAQEPSSGAAADCHCDVGCRSNAEEDVPGDCYVQLQGGLLIGRKRKASATHAEPQATGTEIQDEKGHEEYVSEDWYVQLRGGLLGRKRIAIATHAEPQTTGTEIQDEKGEHISDGNYIQTGGRLEGRKREETVTQGRLQTTTGHGKGAQGECLRAENEMLRQQLVRKMEELESEQILRLKLELNLKNMEIDSLEKQNEELRAECYRMMAKPPRNPRLLCNEYALGHCSASSEQDGDDSN